MSGVTMCDVWMTEVWLSCGPKTVGKCGNSPVYSPERTTCALQCFGCCCDAYAWLCTVGQVYGHVYGELFHCLVLAPEKMAALPRQEVGNFTGHSSYWSLRYLAGFCKPWLKAAFLLRALLLFKPGAKCFHERGNLSCALLILVSLGAFQSHSKLLQLDKGGTKQCSVMFDNPLFI